MGEVIGVFVAMAICVGVGFGVGFTVARHVRSRSG